MLSPANIIAALFTLLPFLAAAFYAETLAAMTAKLPMALRLLGPAVLCVPYLLVTCASGNFRWSWLALYALLPVALSTLMWQANRADPGNTATGVTFWFSPLWVWPSIFAGSSTPGRRTSPSSTRCCYSMRESMDYSYCGNSMELALICACTRATSALDCASALSMRPLRSLG